MYNKNVLSSDLVGIEGAPIDITCSQRFDSAKITFVYDEDNLDIAPEKLGILWYDEENQFYEKIDTTLDKDNHGIYATVTHFSEYTVVNFDEWIAAWEKQFTYVPTSTQEKNSTWQGVIMTPQQLCDEAKDFFGKDVIKLDDLLELLTQGELYVRMINFQGNLENETKVNYYGVFLALKEFYSITSNSEGIPEPNCGGWSIIYSNDTNKEHRIEFDGGVWVKKEYEQSLWSREREKLSKLLIFDGQVDTTDKDNDGLYDVYECDGMRIANGQIIFVSDTNADTDGDGIKDGDEISSYNDEKGYFVIKSNPTVVDSDGDGLGDSVDPEPYKAFDRRFMLVDNFDYIPSVEFVDRHLSNGLLCYDTINNPMKYSLIWDKYFAYATGGYSFINSTLVSNFTDKYVYISSPHYRDFLYHYLINNGKTLYLDESDMQKIVFGQKSNYDHYIYNINQLMLVAEQTSMSDDYINIVTNGGNDFKVACYKKQNCNAVHSNLKYYDDSFAADWGYAIGESLGGMTGKVKKYEEQYIMYFKYYLIDTYEFVAHYDDKVTSLDEEAHKLHESGYAKEYKIIGCLSGAVTWHKGERFLGEDYKNISIDSKAYYD
jgi:hypothetical protein